jgi:hypothetical protein
MYLNHIVPKYIGHQGLCILIDFIEDKLFLFDMGTFQLLLNESDKLERLKLTIVPSNQLSP